MIPGQDDKTRVVKVFPESISYGVQTMLPPHCSEKSFGMDIISKTKLNYSLENRQEEKKKKSF